MPSPLLTVKFFVPQSRPNLTERSSLQKKFEAGLQRPLTLVSAPAGFGKSTLVSMWIGQQSDPGGSDSRFVGTAWLSLDGADNDPLRFWIYVMTALLNRCPAETGYRESAQAIRGLIEMLQADAPPPVQMVLDGMINSLMQLPGPFLLVLDDYHVIQSAAIHEQMSYLLDHQPQNLRLVILTRTDPPLPLTRLRVRGQLSEFRSADLRFSRTEIEEFLSLALGVSIQPDDLMALEKSTEGWIAGLQMAALALQGPLAEADRSDSDLQGDIHAIIASFSGKNVYILDYLVDEVFNRQPADVQAFLLKTSILEKMNADLCDALMQVSPENENLHQPRSKAILEYLERSNLFLIPLDQERHWFRYHHLFADLLRSRLDETWPRLRPSLLVRASIWLEGSGSQEDAIEYALAAEDWERASGLMERHIQTFLELGQLSKIMNWVNRLPREVTASKPGLIIQQAWVMGLAQRKDTFIALLDEAEGLLAGSDPGDDAAKREHQRLWTNLKILRGYQKVIEGKPREGLELLKDLFETYPTGELWEDNWLLWVRGYANRAAGNLEAAAADFQQALDLSRKRLWTDMVCCTDLGIIYHLQGELEKARAVFLEGLALGKAHTSANHGYLNRLLGAYCGVLLDLNELEEANRQGQKGLEWVKWWPSANSRALLFTTLGRVRLAQGDLPGAEELILAAEEERQAWPLNPINDSLVDDALVRLWLAKKDLTAAGKWADACVKTFGEAPGEDPSLNESLEMRWMALAQVRLAQGQLGNRTALDEALKLCGRLEASAKKSGRVRSMIELNVLQASGLQTKTSPKGIPWDPAALVHLETALRLGESGGFIRVFLEEGPLIERMLQEVRCRPARFRQAYLDSILAAFDQDNLQGTDDIERTLPQNNVKSPTPLVESLSGRELEVLRLMASGLSNREMAEKLILSEGTIKSHVHNLMGKLGAQSRTHALALAKRYHLL